MDDVKLICDPLHIDFLSWNEDKLTSIRFGNGYITFLSGLAREIPKGQIDLPRERVARPHPRGHLPRRDAARARAHRREDHLGRRPQ